VTYSLLLDYTYLFSEGGVSLRTYYRSINQKLRDKFGVEEDNLILWKIFRTAIWKFWKEVLNLNLKDLMKCKACGPSPEYLVADGVSIGLLVEHLRGVDNLLVPFASQEVMEAPSYQDRHFVTKPANRKYLKTCAEAGKYPSKRMAKSDDPGMTALLDLIEVTKKTEVKPTEATINIMTDLSSVLSRHSMRNWSMD
jgi:hypothetical protein